MIRVQLKIHGRVQGVFFRAYAVQKAQDLGDVMGWVANESDGTVQLIAEGPENKVHDLVDWCHSGPSTAQVKKVEIEWGQYSGEFDEFDIRY